MRKLYQLAFLIFTLLALLSCDQRGETEKRRNETDKSRGGQSFSKPPAATHLWSQEDIDKSLEYLSGIGGVITRENTIHMTPPFYKGTVPFSYVDKAVYMPSAMHSPGVDIPIYHEYPNWRTIFIYTSRQSVLYELPDGSQTIDTQTGRVLAEAKYLSLIKGEGVDIEERHYGSRGELIFSCKSRISFALGQKVQERDVNGRKETEYYFLFPIY